MLHCSPLLLFTFTLSLRAGVAPPRSLHRFVVAAAGVRMAAPPPEPPRDSLSMEREALARRAAEVADAVREGGPAAAARSLASRVVGGVTVDGALEALERARQEAGGQTGNEAAEAAAAVAAASPESVALADELPDSFEDSVERAVASLARAVDGGATRLVVEFDTSAGDETYTLLSRTMQLARPMLPKLAAALALEPAEADADADADAADPPAAGLQLLVPDEGTAAMVRMQWELPRGTVVGSMGRVSLAVGASALVLVAPGATEVATVQRLLREVEEGAAGAPAAVSGARGSSPAA